MMERGSFNIVLTVLLIASLLGTTWRLVLSFQPAAIFVRAPLFHGIVRIKVHGRDHVCLLAGRKEDNDDERYLEALAFNQIRTNVQNFLTQRAIQSFIFLLIQCRDPHTVRWLENNYEFKNLENYHGSGAFNLTKWSTWDSILMDMAMKPADQVIVSARRRGRGHGGWSKNNPHLEDRFVEYEIDIDPPSLVSRIVSVREQLAMEWIDDLDTLVAANDLVLTSYYENRLTARDEECAVLTESGENVGDDVCLQSIENLQSNSSKSSRPTSLVSGMGKIITSPQTFDRNGMMYLRNAMAWDERTSSPYRKGNFDLLGLLATQEGVHRVLREYRQAGSGREVSYNWLREFYVPRIASHFDGSQPLGRSDDFLEELLLTPPVMKELENTKNKQVMMGLIDPLRMAEDILRMRSEVAREWQEILGQVPENHMDLRRLLLGRQMGKYGPAVPSTTSGGKSDDMDGGFE